MKNNIKLTIIIIVVLIAVLLGIGGFILYSKNVINTYKEITYDELVKLNDSGDNFILFIGADTCSHCTVYKETLNEVIQKYHVLVNYIDISQLEDEELAYIKSNYAFSVTPTTVFIDSGDEPVSERVLEKVKGSQDSDEVVELFKKYGYIK